MSRSVSKKKRRKVEERAENKCEYCKIHSSLLWIPFEVDHIVSIKHGGGSEIENLAYSCYHCNQYKGSDLTTFLHSYQNIIVLFNPRLQKWDEHFKAKKGLLLPKTEIGEETIKLLKMNNQENVEVRAAFQELGLYP